MKLSLLVDFARRLDQMPVSGLRSNARRDLSELSRQILDHAASQYYAYCHTGIDLDIDSIDQQFEQLDSTVERLKFNVKSTIQHLETHYLRQCQQRFLTNELSFSKTIQVLERSASLPDDLQEVILASINNAQNWQWPGMIVRPGHNDFILNMTAMNPLYLLDHHRDLLEPALSRFNEVYRNRICCYEISEEAGKPILKDLPKSQMGLSVLIYYFNFRPIEVVLQWLDELWSATRPGGRVLFTYNDCDQTHGVQRFESGYMSYTPGRLIRDRIQILGFEVMNDLTTQNSISWMELKKPGQLTSLRATQNLARIVERSK